MELITSKENKTLKYAQSLLRKKYRKLHGEYLTEGLRTVTDMMGTGLVTTIFISDNVVAAESTQALLTAAEAAHIKTYQVRADLMSAVEATVNGQGIIAIVKKASTSIEDLVITDGLYVLLDAVQDPGNLGTIIRTALAAGAKGLFLTKGSVDPYNEKTVRSTMSAITKIPIFENVMIEDIKELMANSKLTAYATALENAVPIHDVKFAKQTLLLLGNEANGLSEDWFNLANERITIPMYGPIESLNLAVAGALCMYAVRESWL